MIRGALDKVYSTADEQAKLKAADRMAKKVDFLSTPTKIAFQMNDVIHYSDVMPLPRSHTVDSVFDLIAAANQWGQNGSIWLSRSNVTLIIDDDDRAEKVNLPLKTTDVFDKICTLSKEPTLTQQDFIRMLRRELRNSPGATTILAAVRKIKFSSQENGFSNIQHGGESMGRTVEAEITGATEIADSMTLPLAVYGNPGERDNTATVALTLDMDVQKQRFILKPLPDEIDIIVEQCLGNIRQRIVAGAPKDMPILYGRP